jgi:hypothetical protein
MIQSQAQPLTRRLFVIALGISLMPALMMAYLVLQHPSAKLEVKSENMGGNPSRAVAFLAHNAAQGNLYNPLGWGGYLLWHLPRQIKISIDGRSSTVYPREVLADTYRFYANEASPELPLTKGADFVLVEAVNPMVRSMNTDPRWSVVYKDKEAVLYAGPTESGRRLAQGVKDGRLVSPSAVADNRFP